MIKGSSIHQEDVTIIKICTLTQFKYIKQKLTSEGRKRQFNNNSWRRQYTTFSNRTTRQ